MSWDPYPLLGNLEQDVYGDLWQQIKLPGEIPGRPTDEYLRKLTGATGKEFGAAGHDFRNDANVRPLKPYTPNVRG